jgi:two-component system chemotaxis response regulator CheB
MAGHDIVVVGASSGGIEAVRAMLAPLPENFPAAIFVVIHIPSESPSNLPAILERNSKLPASHPIDGEGIRAGHVYVAPPDHHLLIHKGHMRVVRGPRENRNRPAIDPTFRSAARAYGGRVAGVILSGLLDDGASGLYMVKKTGGIAIVQDPDDATWGDMPRSALEYVKADYIVPAARLAETLLEVVRQPEAMAGRLPAGTGKEVRISEFDLDEIENPEKVGKLSPLACPECNGTLREMENGGPIRYRCHVGHSFTAANLLAEKANTFETALWEALRALEERAMIARRMALHARNRGSLRSMERFETQAETVEQHASTLRQLLLEEEPAKVLPTTDKVTSDRRTG